MSTITTTTATLPAPRRALVPRHGCTGEPAPRVPARHATYGAAIETAYDAMAWSSYGQWATGRFAAACIAERWHPDRVAEDLDYSRG